MQHTVRFGVRLTTNGLFFSCLLALIFVMTGCQSEKKRAIPDVSHIKGEVKIQRFDQALFGLDTLHIATSLPALQQKYGTFANVFFDQIVSLNTPSKITQAPDPLFANKVSGFINYKTTRKLYDTTQIVYKNLPDIERDLSQMMRYYQHYFPKRPIPKFYACVSEYSIGAFTIGDSIVGIGLDMFFGSQYPIYKYPPMNLPEYVTQTLDQAHLPVYVTNAMIDELAGQPASNKMLDVMIHNGKKLYVLESLLPTTPDSVLHCYTTPQMQWCNDNEAEMWAFFLDQKLLYSSDQKEFRRFTEPTPTSNGMPTESPGRTANFIGYKIVSQYMAANPKLSLEQLLAERSAEKIFKISKYKPKK